MNFPHLRDECPCATCDDQRRKKAAAPVQGAAMASSVLPMYKPKTKARAAKSLGITLCRSILRMDVQRASTVTIFCGRSVPARNARGSFAPEHAKPNF